MIKNSGYDFKTAIYDSKWTFQKRIRLQTWLTGFRKPLLTRCVL